MGGIWRSASSAVDLEMDIVVAAGNLDGTNDDGGDGDGDGDDDDDLRYWLGRAMASSKP